MASLDSWQPWNPDRPDLSAEQVWPDAAYMAESQFFASESMNPDGIIVLLNCREDVITSYVTVWKHGLIEVKY